MSIEEQRRVEFHGLYEWLSSTGISPTVPIESSQRLAKAADVLDECAQMARAQAVWTRHASGRTVREIEEETGVPKSTVARLNQIGPYQLHAEDPVVLELANKLMGAVWQSIANVDEDPEPPERRSGPSAISADLVSRWLGAAGIDVAGLTISDKVQTWFADDEDVVRHLVTVEGFTDDQRRAIRQELFEFRDLVLESRSDAPDIDQYSVPSIVQA